MIQFAWTGILINQITIEYCPNQSDLKINYTAIGMTGFEPAAPSSRTKCATKLRYIPLDHLKRQHQVNRAV